MAGKVLVVYHSDTGNTKKAAELVAEGARGAGAEVELVLAMDAKPEAAVKAAAIAVGSPDYFSYMAGQVKVFFDRVFAVRDKLKGKPCVCFITHGGGGAALATVEKLAQAVNMKLAAKSVAVKGSPSGADADACKALGAALASAKR